MKITIKNKKIRLTKKIEDHIKEKADSLEKFFNLTKNEKDIQRKTLKEIVVEIEKETNHHKKGFLFRAKMKAHFPRKDFFAESITENLALSITEAKEEIERGIKRHKSKIISKRRRNERKVKKEIKIAPQARMYRKGRIRQEGL